MQIRTLAEIGYVEKGSYEFLSCNHKTIQSLCKDIESLGSNLKIYATTNKYCFYAPLLAKEEYYCVDRVNSGRTKIYPPCSIPDYLCQGTRF